MRTVLFFALAMVHVFLLSSLTCKPQQESPAAQQQSPEQSPDEQPLLVSIKTRDNRVDVYAGRCFCVYDNDDKLLARMMNDTQFEQSYPQLFEDVEEALANIMWAGAQDGGKPLDERHMSVPDQIGLPRP